ncbi:MAG: glycosyltransferase [Solirubrobacterales bacterium]|nr:glycosyltransferase [Solirubrobacterales bacterium]
MSRHFGGSTAVSPRDGGRRARPRVLFLSCHLPYPPISGGRRRELELIRRIGADFDVHLVVVSKTPSEDIANVDALRLFCSDVEVFSAEEVRARGTRAQLPLAVARHRCPAATRRIAQLLACGRVDLVHVEGFYLIQHVPEWSTVPLLLVEQNVEYELERQTAVAAGAHDLETLDVSARTRTAEQASWRRATLLGAITREDRETILEAVPEADVRVIPDGADHVHAAQERPAAAAPEHPGGPLLVFVGNFAYAPNVDAAVYLCESILPRIHERLPDVHVWLVGNAPPRELCSLESSRVWVTGTVPDVVPYTKLAEVVVCPLRIGGGIKVKTIEALSCGKALVTTPIGAQGLPPAARAALVIAGEASAFAEATLHVLLDPERRHALERDARRAAGSLPTWDDAAGALGCTYDELARSRGGLHVARAGGSA